MLVYLAQQQVHLPANQLALAHVAATEMTNAVLSLRAALPDKTPHEIVLSCSIMSLPFSKSCCCLQLSVFATHQVICCFSMFQVPPMKIILVLGPGQQVRHMVLH